MLSTTHNASATEATTLPVPVIVYVQVRPTPAGMSKCMAQLDRLIAAHPDVDVTVAGLSRDARNIRVTMGVNPGPLNLIAKPAQAQAAEAAFAFVGEIFTQLFDYLPHYSVAPTSEERAAVNAINHPDATNYVDLDGDAFALAN